jgi:hypothetical protein
MPQISTKVNGYGMVKAAQTQGGVLVPKGPQGQKRPADTIGCAVMVAKIATGETEDEGYSAPARKNSGLAGAKARNESLTPERRAEIAKKAANSRWR